MAQGMPPQTDYGACTVMVDGVSLPMVEENKNTIQVTNLTVKSFGLYSVMDPKQTPCYFRFVQP